MATTPTVVPITSKKERPGHGLTPTVATPTPSTTSGHGADSNSRPSTSVVKIGKIYTIKCLFLHFRDGAVVNVENFCTSRVTSRYIKSLLRVCEV